MILSRLWRLRVPHPSIHPSPHLAKVLEAHSPPPVHDADGSVGTVQDQGVEPCQDLAGGGGLLNGGIHFKILSNQKHWYPLPCSPLTESGATEECSSSSSLSAREDELLDDTRAAVARPCMGRPFPGSCPGLPRREGYGWMKGCPQAPVITLPARYAPGRVRGCPGAAQFRQPLSKVRTSARRREAHAGRWSDRQAAHRHDDAKGAADQRWSARMLANRDPCRA